MSKAWLVMKGHDQDMEVRKLVKYVVR